MSSILISGTGDSDVSAFGCASDRCLRCRGKPASEAKSLRCLPLDRQHHPGILAYSPCISDALVSPCSAEGGPRPCGRFSHTRRRPYRSTPYRPGWSEEQCRFWLNSVNEVIGFKSIRTAGVGGGGVGGAGGGCFADICFRMVSPSDFARIYAGQTSSRVN